MSRFLRATMPLACLIALQLIALQPAAWLWAANEGQEDLDRATETKLTAHTLGDLDEVVRTIESALSKGLDEGNTQFAHNLLASTLVQRATARAALIARVSSADPRVAEIRKTTLADLEKAVKLNPQQPHALLLIAQLERAPGGDVQRADKALEQAIELSTNDPDLKAKALSFRASVDETPEKKLADLDAAIRAAPQLIEAVRARGILRADLGKLEEALADFNKAIELDPKHMPTFEIKAIVLTRLKRYDEAMVALDQARQLSPEAVDPLLRKAQIHALQANVTAAMHELDQAHRMDPENIAVLLLRASIEADPVKKGEDLDEAVRAAPNNPFAWRSRGLWRVDQGKLDEALRDLDKAIELQADETANYDAKLVALARMKKYDEALAVLEKMRALKPKSAYPLIQKAKLRLQQGNLPEAIKELDAAEQLDPNDVGVLQLRAAVYQDLSAKKTAAEEDKAAADKDKAAADKDKDKAAAESEEAKAYREKAMADIRKALEIEPESAASLRLHAVLLSDAGKTDEAIGELEKIRQLDPRDALTLIQLAMLYGIAQKPEQAIECYSAIVADDPNQWMALRGRGDLLLNIGKHAEAIADYDRALKLQPKDTGVLNNLAWVLATSPDDKLRDGRRAIVLATQACELTDYKKPHVLSTLGAAYAETGDFESAIKWSSKGIELGSDEEKEALGKEAETYRAGKPFRELLSEGKPPKAAADKQPKQDSTKEDSGKKADPGEKLAPAKKDAEK